MIYATLVFKFPQMQILLILLSLFGMLIAIVFCLPNNSNAMIMSYNNIKCIILAITWHFHCYHILSAQQFQNQGYVYQLCCQMKCIIKVSNVICSMSVNIDVPLT